MGNLRLPPVFDAHPSEGPPEGGDPFAWACAHAGGLGAGAFVHAVADCELRCAVVLEPDPAGPPAHGVLLAAGLALGDALASLGPPNLVLEHDWPATLMLGGAVVGGVRLAAGPASGSPPGSSSAGVPDWMVLGAAVVLALTGARAADPGIDPGNTALAEEGFETGPEAIAESYAHHLLNRISLYQETGFAGLRAAWLARWPGRGRPVSLATLRGPVAGEAADVDGEGALVLADGRRIPPAWMSVEVG